MRILSRIEEVILIAIWKLKDNAYGVSICDLVSEMTNREWPLGAIYVPLDKLSRKEYVRKTISNPTAIRGGRSKCLYELTPEGKSALKEIQEINNSVWDGVSDIAFN